MASRVPANTLKLSLAALAAWLAFEGFESAPYVPTKGDVPTIGYGSTHYENGTRVKMTDTPISRARAEQLALGELNRTYAACVRKSLGGTLVSQVEFDVAVDFAGQYGCTAWANSSMAADLKAGNYSQHCSKYLRYKLMTSPTNLGPGWVKRPSGGYQFDCSTPGNKVCRGVWSRQLDRYESCTGAQ
jgi:lysozyme